METLGWIVILIVGLAFAAVIAWLGTLWITTRAGRAMTQIFRPSVGAEELEEIRRELAELRRLIEDLKRRKR
jgi:hypothetical protein